MPDRAGRAARVTAGLGLILAILAAAFRFGPTVLLALGLAWPGAESWPLVSGHDPDLAGLLVESRHGRLPADLYEAPGSIRGIVLVHGLSRSGRRHPEIMRLARLLARRGITVMVPEIEGMTRFRLTGNEIDDIAAGLAALARRGLAPGVVGLSFGAGPALLAGATQPRLWLAGSFGGYADLCDVIRFITTGAHAFAGRHYVQRQEDYNRWKLLALLAGLAENAADRALLAGIAERKLADPSTSTEAAERALHDPGQRVMALVLNRQEARVPALLAALSADMRAALDRLSPLPAVPRLSGRLLIAHGIADESIPFTESLRLAEAARGRARVAVLHTFHHTGPAPLWGRLARRVEDAWNLLRLTDALLTAPAE
jgi:hypothetical protein